MRRAHVVRRFRTQKTAALLAYLALHPHRAHPRDALVDRFWPEVPPAHGRQSLSQALSSLRQLLEPVDLPDFGLFRADRLTIRLNAERFRTDVAEFEAPLRLARNGADEAVRRGHLRRAVALYGGELLPGLYDDWVLAERARLADAYLEAVGRLIAGHEAEGDLATALILARQAVRADPLREENHRRLIRLLTAAGRSGEARRQESELERLLRDELAEPSPAARGSRFPAPRSPLATPGAASGASLPHALNRFFGREAEIEALATRLQEDGTRLITLTGPGGSGKSRLALEVARRLEGAWAGRVWSVPLVDLREARQIEEAIRDALGLPRSPHREPHEQIVAALAGRATLLLLDNYEHLLPAGAALLRELLEHAPGLTALVTSRRRLGIAGEREAPVRPLPIGPAVSFFRDRAAAAHPDFESGPETMAAVTALCEGLEGIPLAIELAAARAAVLTPEQMLARLSERLDLLVSHRPDGPERHRSLQAALEWSYRLLAPELQRFFARLSVFRGGWTEEAAAAVCEEPLALDFLEQLRDASLVQPAAAAGTIRFRMLETLREFAAEQLSHAETLDLGDQHGCYYLRLAACTEWLRGLEAETQNLLAGLTFFGATGDADRGLEMAWELSHYWEDHCQVAAGRRELTRLLALAPQRRNKARAHGLQLADMLAGFQGEVETAEQFLKEALTLNRELGLERGIAGVLTCLSKLAREQGDFVRARSLVNESLEIAYRIGDWKFSRHPLFSLAVLEAHQGNLDRARLLLTQRLEIDRAVGDADLMADTLSALGGVALQSGDVGEAKCYFEESLAHHRSRGHRPAIGWALLSLAAAARARGDIESAETLCEESISIQREVGDRRGLAASLQYVGSMARDRGDWSRARRYLGESLELHRVLRDRLAVTTCSEEIGALLRDTQRPAAATRLFAGAAAHRADLPAPLTPRDQAARETCLAELHASLGDAAFTAVWQEGSRLTAERLADVALAALDAMSDVATMEGAAPDLSDARWERVRPLLPSCPRTGRPRGDNRRVLDGILMSGSPRCHFSFMSQRSGRRAGSLIALSGIFSSPTPPQTFRRASV